MTPPRARGFVLLAVLWVMVGVGTIGLGLALLARRAVGVAHNRRAEAIAMWLAEDCASRAEAAIGAALDHRGGDTESSSEAAQATWSRLDAAVAASPLLSGTPCDLTIRPTGTTIDINTADDSLLSRLFVALGSSATAADSLTDAILDWRDADDVPRPTGAESAWYRAQGRAPPRNASFADVRELASVRGFEVRTGLDSVLGVEADRILLSRAPLAVVAALPGFTSEAVARVADHRALGSPVPDIVSLGAELSPAGRSTLLANYPDVVRLTTSEPDAWLLMAHGTAGRPAVTFVLELRLVRAGNRAAVVRRRTWIQ